MATKTWVGTDATTPNDWSVSGNWTPSGVPVATDDVYFVSGAADVTAGLDQSAITLNTLTVGTKYTGNIGSSAAPLEVDVSSTFDYAQQIGTTYIEGSFPTVIIQSTSSDSPALTLTSSTITNIRALSGRGTVFVDNGSTVTGAIDMIGCTGLTIEIEANATVSAADVTIDSGSLLCSEQLDTVTQFGGLVEMRNSDGTTNTITIYDGKTKYKVSDDAILTTLTMYGGFFDMRGSASPSHTITNATLYSGALVDERNGLQNTTWTNAISLQGGIIKADAGRTLAIS